VYNIPRQILNNEEPEIKNGIKHLWNLPEEALIFYGFDYSKVRKQGKP